MQGLLLLKKGEGITSYKAVAAVKRLTGEKRVGHTGTLDPMATGVLPVFVGRPTALCSYMLEADKEYAARVKLGTVTDTGDITGKVLREQSVNITPKMLKEAVSKFVGKIKQTPPMYSALKKDGVPLYKLAREGKTVEIPEREVEIYSLKITKELENGEFEFSAKVSKGTYIRSLAMDIGDYLGCGATLTALCRTKAAGFSVEECVDLDNLTQENISEFLLSEEIAVKHLREVTVTDKQAVRFCNGGQLSLDRLRTESISNGELFRVKNNDLFLGVGEADTEKQLLKIRCIINYPKQEKVAVALGTFDGVHKGHRQVLDIPSCYKKIAVMFLNPPKSVLKANKELLNLPEEKIKIIKQLGIDDIHILDFNSVKDMSAEDFLLFLKKEFSPSLISCGFNYRFGKEAKGDTAMLESFCKENKIILRCCPPATEDGEVISSTRIRKLLMMGEVEAANKLLMDSFSFVSTVISGDKRGRTIGFPTINQQYPADLVKPKFGVYKTKVYIDEKQYSGITNIGVRPTYPADFIISETYIEDFSGNLYGKDIKISLISFLREEKKFSSLEELKKQIKEDIKR